MSYKENRKGFLQHFGIKHHEYWSWWLLVIPVWPMWIWYMLRTGKITWFTAVNPGMEDSGFMGESKIKILNSIPSKYLPKTIFFNHKNYFDKGKLFIPFPIIAKPDIGGRGRKVEILNSLHELEKYHKEIAEDYMIQEIISHPIELGVFYIRIPNEEKGKVVSIAEKGFLKVKGNGHQTIKELMQKDYRASLQIDRLNKHINLESIPNLNEEILLEPIGNHCRGTSFINRNDLINEKLNAVFDTIAKEINGFYYGRFDLKVTSWEDLYEGKNISILELNGLTADAAHIFDPQYRLRDAYFTQVKNCISAFKIAKHNLAKGTKTTSVKELYLKSKNNL